MPIFQHGAHRQGKLACSNMYRSAHVHQGCKYDMYIRFADFQTLQQIDFIIRTIIIVLASILIILVAPI